MVSGEPKNSANISEETKFMAVDSLFDNKYIIRSEQFRGGMAALYRVTSLRDEKDRAIKVPLSLANAELANLSFHREMLALSDLSHKNIVKIVDSGSLNNMPYLVLEWLAGGDLGTHIEKNGPWSWGEFYENLGRPLLNALVYIHQRRWAHRDFKPQNILFDETGLPKIIDFGIARQTDLPQLGSTFSQTGSPPYTPPEADDGYRSDRRDLYSWAAIAISCMAGKLFRTADEMRIALESLRDSGSPKERLSKALAQAP